MESIKNLFLCNKNLNLKKKKSKNPSTEFQKNKFFNASSDVLNDSKINFDFSETLSNNIYFLMENGRGPEENEEELISLIKTQAGCRYFQGLIMKAPKFANDILYACLKPKMMLLICDKFGNYLYQQFLDVLFSKNLNHFIEFVLSNFQIISFSPFGTRVIQKLLDCIHTKESDSGSKFLLKLIEKIRGHVMEMSNDENSNHVIQKLLSFVGSPISECIFNEIFESFLLIASTKNGCCVIQKCLTSGTEEQREKIINQIIENTFYLITNQYGNYVYQYLIQLDEDWVILKVIHKISPQIISLCQQKYSSNVIEKICEMNNHSLVEEFISKIVAKEENILSLTCHQYGNYIIQKILSVTMNQVLVNKIISIIGNNIKTIVGLSFGKKLMQKLIKKYPVLCFYMNNNF